MSTSDSSDVDQRQVNPDPAARLGQRGRDVAPGQRFGLAVAEAVSKTQARKIGIGFGRDLVQHGSAPDT